MLIKRLIVRGFRSLYDIDIEFEPDITVLVGENDLRKIISAAMHRDYYRQKKRRNR